MLFGGGLNFYRELSAGTVWQEFQPFGFDTYYIAIFDLFDSHVQFQAWSA